MFAVLFLLTGCGDDANHGGSGVDDAPRLITFAPGLTEMAVDMGLGDQIVGIDKFSDDELVSEAEVVGDFLNVRVEPILAVKPDVVFFNMQPRHFETLAEVAPDLELIYVRLDDLDDIATAMQTIATAAGRPEAGEQTSKAFMAKLDEVAAMTRNLPKKRVMYVLGHTQMMGVGGESFTGEMIERAGGINVLKDEFIDWKEPSLERVIELRPQVVICQSDEAHAEEARAYWQRLFEDAGVETRVEVVTDPKWTQQAGHLAEYTRRLAELIHPESIRPQ